MSADTEFEIKEEIFVKEENDIGEECIVQANSLKCSSERIPVVYTTRLDDMLIFKKNFATLAVDDIVENVILESKPKLTKPIQKEKELIPCFDGHPFFELEDKIRHFNNMVILEENLPLKVQTTKRVERNVGLPRRKESKQPLYKGKNINQLLKLCKPCNIRLVPSSMRISINRKSHILYDIESAFNTMTFVKGVGYKIDIGCMIVFRNLKTKSSESYVIAKDGIFSKISDTLVSVSRNRVRSFVPFDLKFGLDVDVCCWFFREYVMKSFIWQKNVDPSIMRIPHSCPSGRCDCCCKRNIKDADVQEVTEEKTTEASAKSLARQLVRSLKILPKQVPKQPPVKNFINEALEYTRKDIVASDNSTNRRVDLTDVVDDRLGVQILTGYSDKTEFYEIEQDGNIVKNVEIMYSQTSNGFRKEMKLNAQSKEVLCCWRKRDSMLQSFELKYKPAVTQFIRTPHPCPPDNCICCCKPNSDTQFKFFKSRDSISSKYKPKHSTNYTSVIKQRRKFRAKNIHTNKSELENVRSIPQADNTQNSSIQCEGTNRPVDSRRSSDKWFDDELNYENFIAGDIIGKTVDSTLKNVTQKTPRASHSEKVSSNKTDTNQKSVSRKIVEKKTVRRNIQQKAKENRSLIKEELNCLPSTQPQQLVPRPPLLLQSVPIIALPTLQQARPPLIPQNPGPSHFVQTIPPIQSNVTSSQNTLKQARPPLVPQKPGPSQFVQTIPPSQSNLASSQNTLKQVRPPLVLQNPGPSQFIPTIPPTQSNIASSQNNVSPASNPLANIPLQNDTQDPTVNSLVNSILQRFNDVRLIITPDGDVSAELNMPMQSLTTPELQLLSKILSHAKQQVKALKAAGHLNSSKNTVLNPWQTNLENNTDTVPAPGANALPGGNIAPDAFTTPVIIQNSPTAPIVIANTDVQNKPTAPIVFSNTDITAKTHTSTKSKVPMTLSKSNKSKDNTINTKARLDAFQCFTNVSALKMKEYLTSCRSYLSETKTAYTAPKISDVFTLNEDGKGKKSEVTSKTIMNSENVLNSKTASVKRKSNQTRVKNTKKPKSDYMIETVEIDDDPLAVESPTGRSMPVIEPSTSTVQMTGLVDNNVMPAPILSGINTPYVVPSGTAINSNQMFVAVPFTIPGNIQPIEPPSNEDISTKDDDCILGF